MDDSILEPVIEFNPPPRRNLDQQQMHGQKKKVDIYHSRCYQLPTPIQRREKKSFMAEETRSAANRIYIYTALDLNIFGEFTVHIARRIILARDELRAPILGIKDGTRPASEYSTPNLGGALPNNLREVRGDGVIGIISRRFRCPIVDRIRDGVIAGSSSDVFSVRSSRMLKHAFRHPARGRICKIIAPAQGGSAVQLTVIVVSRQSVALERATGVRINFRSCVGRRAWARRRDRRRNTARTGGRRGRGRWRHRG